MEFAQMGIAGGTDQAPSKAVGKMTLSAPSHMWMQALCL
jgi:hypothetical protein